MRWCEEQRGVYYCFGLARNPRLARNLEEPFAKLKAAIEEGRETMPVRQFREFRYRTHKSWSRSRRVIGKAEVLPKGENPRFIVTNLPAKGWDRPSRERFRTATIYEGFYCARGDMENRIKEQQLDLFADRTSTHWMASNPWRLWFSAFAHLIVSVLRAEVLPGTSWAQATIGQIRLKLFKIGARVQVSCRRVHFELASAYPWVKEFTHAYRRAVSGSL
jgi:hypothetical protein